MELLGLVLGLVTQAVSGVGCEAVSRPGSDATESAFVAVIDQRKCRGDARTGANLPTWSEQPDIQPRPPVPIDVRKRVQLTHPDAPRVELSAESYSDEAGFTITWSIHDAFSCLPTGDHPAWLESGLDAEYVDGSLTYLLSVGERIDAHVGVACSNRHGETLATLHVTE